MEKSIQTKRSSNLERRGIQQVIFGGEIGEACAHSYFFETLGPDSMD